MKHLSSGGSSSAHHDRKRAFLEFKQRFFSMSGYISFTLAAFFALYLIFSDNNFWPHAFLMVLPASLPVVRQPIFASGKTKPFFGYLLLMLVFIGMVILTVPLMGFASLLTFGGVLAGSWVLTAALLLAEKIHDSDRYTENEDPYSVSVHDISDEETEEDYWDDDHYLMDLYSNE